MGHPINPPKIPAGRTATPHVADSGARPGGAIAPPAPDPLRLAGRVQLEPGERFAGSAVSAVVDDCRIPLARIDGPAGPRLRIGLHVLDEDIHRWRAANRGGTVDLGVEDVAALRGALVGMREAGRRGQAEVQDLQRQLAQLQGDVRNLYRQQFPGLTRARARELDRIDEVLEEVRGREQWAQDRIQERVDRLPPDLRAEHDAASPDRQLQIIAGWYANQPEYRNVPVEMLHAQKMRDLARAREQVADIEARRAGLVEQRVPLTAEQDTELARLTADRDRVQDRLEQLTDDGVIAEGQIPTRWGTLTYETVMRDPCRAGAAPAYWLNMVRPGETEPDGEPVELAEKDLGRLDERLAKMVPEAENAGRAEPPPPQPWKPIPKAFLDAQPDVHCPRCGSDDLMPGEEMDDYWCGGCKSHLRHATPRPSECPECGLDLDRAGRPLRHLRPDTGQVCGFEVLEQMPLVAYDESVAAPAYVEPRDLVDAKAVLSDPHATAVSKAQARTVVDYYARYYERHGHGR